MTEKGRIVSLFLLLSAKAGLHPAVLCWPVTACGVTKEEQTMIRPATMAIQKTFDEKNIKYRVNQVGDSSIVEAGFVLDNGPNVIVRFISRDDDNDVAVRVFDLVKVKEDQQETMIKVINDLNKEFRFLKFVIHDSGSVHVENDLYLRTENVGEVAAEMFVRYMQILKQAYPKLMKALWA